MAKKITKKEKVVKKDIKKVEPVLKTDEMDQDELLTELETYKNTDFTSLIEQVDTEYNLGWWSFKPKFDEFGIRLKLYNNQKRDKEAVGDPLLFTIHQTVLASLYDDKLNVSFSPREQGDDEVAENDNILAEYDSEEMEKDVLDYNWDWDATFYGTGLVCLMEFDRERMLPIPEYWNRMTVIVDPRATSVNGDLRGRGRARFLGREVRLTKGDMDDAGVYFSYDDLKNETKDLHSFTDEAETMSQEARGYQQTSKFSGLKGDNVDHRCLEWFTMWKGKRVFVTLADNRKKVIRYHELKTKDIPVLDRRIYPLPNSFDGISIPDLVEDKQRARAVLQNLGLKGAKANLHPMYLFNTNKIKNRADLNFDFNKFIGVDGEVNGAVAVMPKDQVKQEVQYIMDVLDSAAQKATATPDIQQGARGDTKRSATELSLQNQKVDTRYSLSAKIFGWSEKRFWRQWHNLYREHFKDGIDEKIVRVVGALGATYRPFRREDIVSKTDLDVSVESRVLSEAKQFNKSRNFEGFLTIIAQDPTANLRYGFKTLGKLKGLKKDEIDLLLPPTIEELRAEDENKQLEADNLVEVQATDDHVTHLEIHNKLSDTPAKYAHIEAHKRAMLLARVRPDIIPQLPSAQNPTGGKGMQQGSGTKAPVNEANVTM